MVYRLLRIYYGSYSEKIILYKKGTPMFNQTNLFIGSIYAISIATGGIVGLGILKLVENEDRIARNAAQKAIASASDYLQGVYHKRVDTLLELLESSDVSPETEDEIRHLVDCPL